MKMRDLPNAITIARILMVAPITWFLIAENYFWVFVLFLLAGISDGVDGFLARRYNWSSKLGGLLDPLADKLLLVSVYAALAWNGMLPLWLAALVVLRDVVIVAGAMAYHFTIEQLEANPSLSSKLNTVAQILFAATVVAHAAGLVPLSPLVYQIALYTVLATTIASGLGYVVTWSERARRKQAGAD